MNPTSLDIEFEKAVRMLVAHFPVSKEGARKPVFFHDIRVGTYLYQKNYPKDIVLAGLLHDAIEWSDITEEMIREDFGENILQIVLANSKDRSIQDQTERIDDMMKRCVAVGEAALIVKAADTIDSFKHYTKTNNQDELTNHCFPNALAILKHRPETFQDPIFDELEEWISQ